MNRSDFKKALKSFSKDEIIEALSHGLISEYAMYNIVSNAREIKFNNLTKKSDKAFNEAMSITAKKEDSLKSKIDAMTRRENKLDEYRKIQKQIDKLLEIRY